MSINNSDPPIKRFRFDLSGRYSKSIYASNGTFELNAASGDTVFFDPTTNEYGLITIGTNAPTHINDIFFIKSNREYGLILKGQYNFDEKNALGATVSFSSQDTENSSTWTQKFKSRNIGVGASYERNLGRVDFEAGLAAKFQKQSFFQKGDPTINYNSVAFGGEIGLSMRPIQNTPLDVYLEGELSILNAHHNASSSKQENDGFTYTSTINTELLSSQRTLTGTIGVNYTIYTPKTELYFGPFLSVNHKRNEFKLNKEIVTSPDAAPEISAAKNINLDVSNPVNNVNAGFKLGVKF